MPRSNRSTLLASILGLAVAGILAGPAKANVVNLNPTKDNSIYSDLTGNSNGSGDGVFAGRNSLGGLRRGFLAFDLSSIPAGSLINSVSLTLVLSQSNSGTAIVSLHRVNADWGEGTSNGTGQGAPATAGDATWLRRFFNTTSWTTPGGDFVATPSASQSVSGLNPYVWSSAGLTSDVQAWRASPSSNFGWILIGDEGLNNTAKKFGSRESGTPPVLSVDFTPHAPGAAPAALGLLSLAMGALGARLARRRRPS